VVKRSSRPSWGGHERRNFVLNVALGLAVLAALLILVIAIGLSYYGEHLASVGSVAGRAISKDQLRDRTSIESWRLLEAGNRIRTLANDGKLSAAQAEQQQGILGKQREQVVPIALERLIDNRVQASLAAEEGVAVSEADIDARLVEEARTPELRHAWMIEIVPEVDSDVVEPTAAQTAAAKARADAALADLQAGKKWEDVASALSTDPESGPPAGDLGWIQANDNRFDEAFAAAIFGATPNQPTGVIAGQDGAFRIGRVTEISAEMIDEAYQAKLSNDGVDLAKYREVIRGDVTRQKLEDKIVADAIKPGPQRRVQEIYLSAATAQLGAGALKVRHILYSPKDDPSAAQAGEIPDTDPAWAQAKADADAAYAKLVADPTQFDAVARAESDEESARGEAGTGGVLEAYVSTDSSYVPTFSKPILDAKPADDQILAPIKTEFGYHIVQVLGHAPDLAAIKADADAGADFAKLARDLSEGQEAGQGGDLGWIARGQREPELIDAIFAGPVGGTSEVVPIAEDGSYLFKVVAEESRTPQGRQLDEIKQSAFRDWYEGKKAAVEIVRDSAITTPTG
ncbi:MAG: peptidylprolyl isomerase, partial [Candidatus Limnocylindrales bacterium]